MLTLTMTADIEGGIPVELFKTNHGYAVRYGLQVDSNVSLDTALRLFDNAMRHSLSCAGVEE